MKNEGPILDLNFPVICVVARQLHLGAYWLTLLIPPSLSAKRFSFVMLAITEDVQIGNICIGALVKIMDVIIGNPQGGFLRGKKLLLNMVRITRAN